MASASCRRLRPVIISMCVIRRRRGRVWHTCVQMSQASRPFFFVWTLLVSHSRCALRFVPPYRFSPPFFPPRLSLCNAWVHRLSCVFLLLAKISRRLFFLVWFLFSSVLFLSKKKKMNKTNSTEIDQQRENEWRGAGTSFSDVIIILFPHVTLKHERIIYLSLRPILGFFFFLFFTFFVCTLLFRSVVVVALFQAYIDRGHETLKRLNWPVTLGHDPLHRIVVCLEPDRLNYIFFSLSIVVVVVVLFITTKTYSSSRNTHYVSVSLAHYFFFCLLLPPFCCCCCFFCLTFIINSNLSDARLTFWFFLLFSLLFYSTETVRGRNLIWIHNIPFARLAVVVVVAGPFFSFLENKTRIIITIEAERRRAQASLFFSVYHITTTTPVYI
jgi:hypothetical protein